jgi:hypothetical protein
MSNMMSPALVTLLLIASAAKDVPTLRYLPPIDADEERPVATVVMVKSKGNDFNFEIAFNHEPWGESCKTRCANATFYLDTDGNKATGLQVGEKSPQTGADLAVTVQGIREYKEVSADTLLRVKVRLLGNGVADLEDGQTLAELDHRHDPERVKAQKNEVSLRIDATDAAIPVGRTVRVVYQPPGASPVVGTFAGISDGTGGPKRPIQILRGKRH